MKLKVLFLPLALVLMGATQTQSLHDFHLKDKDIYYQHSIRFDSFPDSELIKKMQLVLRMTTGIEDIHVEDKRITASIDNIALDLNRYYISGEFFNHGEEIYRARLMITVSEQKFTVTITDIFELYYWEGTERYRSYSDECLNVQRTRFTSRKRFLDKMNTLQLAFHDKFNPLRLDNVVPQKR